MKYSRKLNRLDDIVLFTVADKEPSLSASLSFSAFPTLLELPSSPAAEDTDCLHMDSLCQKNSRSLLDVVSLAVTSVDA